MNHYFTDNTDLKHNICVKKVSINGHDFVFFTDNGVFSKNGLDFGTRSLLESLPDYIHGDVLDFGCGYGPIGIYLKKIFNCNVDMIDINNRSIELAIKNALQNNVNVNVFNSNIYENVTKKYDFIITNPPIRVGKKILYQILFDAKDHLKDGGQIWLVINKDQGAKSLLKDLNKQYKAELVCKNKGFYIICAQYN
ncbi:MAG: methyltransferase [Bacilli bacterium]|nr:methyltransferase [Bacilli bacterium]